jgi:hypothetical protein
MKIVISVCPGGFGLSRKAAERLRDEGYPLAIEEFKTRTEWAEGEDPGLQALATLTHNQRLRRMPRDDPALIRIVEELGPEVASGENAKLKVVEIPDDVEWEIDEYNGSEQIAEKHRTWN